MYASVQADGFDFAGAQALRAGDDQISFSVSGHEKGGDLSFRALGPCRGSGHDSRNLLKKALARLPFLPKSIRLNHADVIAKNVLSAHGDGGDVGKALAYDRQKFKS